MPPAGWNRTQQSPSDVTYTSKDGAVELSAKQGRTTEDLLTHWQRFEEGFHGTPGTARSGWSARRTPETRR
ncbi:hypothetical protein BLA24_00065 [Streptomyces cinnamoneus]|uniref:Uncharacterized protein n=1 Tax=Streptomyces cinnamoneus TaxID=53446 RepID=A0A2G1XQU9_STRCJ|nr:hypothetical protein BLA24_00065 [Streptomyces cinnamoneus]